MNQRLKLIIKDHFLAGLLVLAPALLVIMIFHFIFGGLLNWIHDVPVQTLTQTAEGRLAGVFTFLFLIGILISSVLLVSLLGFLSKLYFGRKILEWLKEAMQRIPFFGAIYSSLDQLFKAVSSSGGKQFSRVVYIEYPRKEVWAVAFVTGDVHLKGIPPGYLSVFIPTVPNPTSGFHLMVKESEVIESGLKVDDAFKLILSLGVAAPI